MESQNGGFGQKPLILHDMDDIPSIDDEDTSPSTLDDQTEISDASFNSVKGSDSGSVVVDKSKEVPPKEEGSKEKAKCLPVEVDTKRLDSFINDSDNYDKQDSDLDKIADETSCCDDTPIESLTSKFPPNSYMEKPEECVTHSISFPLKSKGLGKESLCTETESRGDDSRMSSQESPSNKSKTKTKKSKKSGTKDGRDSDSSVASSKKKGSTKTHIKSKFAPGSFEYIQERLSGRIFSGWVEERRWVENLAGYRDVIDVDEWEKEMNNSLMAIIRSIPGVQEGTKWINITPPTSFNPCYCMWSLLTTPPTPGHYWFIVTGVALHPQFGLRVMLKIIRSIHPHDGELAAARRERRKVLAMRQSGHGFESLSEQVHDWLHQLKLINLSVIWSAITTTFTFSNIRETLRFIVVLSMTLVVGLVALVRESHHYAIQFIYAAGVFFHNITPFLQSLLSFFEKIIGGFYLLIAMVYKDARRPSQPPPNISVVRPPLALTGNNSDFSPSHAVVAAGPRTIKYVPPEQWVYRSQNTSSSDS